MRWATAISGPLVAASLERGEIELGDRLFDQPLVVRIGEGLSGDLRRGEQRELGDLGADRAQGTARLGFDLPLRLLEPALPVGLRLLSDALALGVGDAPRLGQDLLGVVARAADQRAMLLQETPGLRAAVVRLGECLPNALATLVDHRLDAAE